MSRSSPLRWLLAVSSLVGLMLAMLAPAAFAQGQSPDEECPDGTTAIAKYDFNEESGQFTVAFGGDIVSVSGDSDSATWTSDVGIDAVFVFGGNDGQLIEYDEEQFSGSVSNDELETGGGETAAISHITFCVEEQDTVSLTINKIDGESEDPLADVEFDLYRDDGDDAFDSGDTLVRSDATAEDGQLTFEGIDPDATYWLVEPEAPEGFEPIEAMQITFPDRTDEMITVENVRVEDEAETVSLTVTKIEVGSPETTLAGAMFDLYLDVDEDGDLGSDDTLVVEGKTTGPDGTVTFPELDPDATYLLMETEAPAGYTIMGEGLEVVDLSEGTAVTIENAPETVVSPTVSLTVTKVEQGATDNTLAGATFELFADVGTDAGELDDDDSQHGTACTTGEDGVCVFSGLAPNSTYFLVETQAPDQYEIVGDGVREITTGEEEVSETVPNAPITEVRDVVEERPQQPAPEGEERPQQPAPEADERQALAQTGTETSLAWFAVALIAGGAGVLLFERRHAYVIAQGEDGGRDSGIWTSRRLR